MSYILNYPSLKDSFVTHTHCPIFNPSKTLGHPRSFLLSSSHVSLAFYGKEGTTYSPMTACFCSGSSSSLLTSSNTASATKSTRCIAWHNICKREKLHTLVVPVLRGEEQRRSNRGEKRLKLFPVLFLGGAGDQLTVNVNDWRTTFAISCSPVSHVCAAGLCLQHANSSWWCWHSVSCCYHKGQWFIERKSKTPYGVCLVSFVKFPYSKCHFRVSYKRVL